MQSQLGEINNVVTWLSPVKVAHNSVCLDLSLGPQV